RTGRRGEVQVVVDVAIQLQRVRDVVADKAEAIVPAQRLDVAQRAGDEVVHADDLVAPGQETLAEMGTDEPRSAGDNRPHAATPLHLARGVWAAGRLAAHAVVKRQ